MTERMRRFDFLASGGDGSSREPGVRKPVGPELLKGRRISSQLFSVLGHAFPSYFPVITNFKCSVVCKVRGTFHLEPHKLPRATAGHLNCTAGTQSHQTEENKRAYGLFVDHMLLSDS